MGGLEGLHHGDDRGGLGPVALPAPDLEGETAAVDQQADDDLGVDPPLLGVTDLALIFPLFIISLITSRSRLFENGVSKSTQIGRASCRERV